MLLCSLLQKFLETKSWNLISVINDFLDDGKNIQKKFKRYYSWFCARHRAVKKIVCNISLCKCNLSLTLHSLAGIIYNVIDGAEYL